MRVTSADNRLFLEAVLYRYRAGQCSRAMQSSSHAGPLPSTFRRSTDHATRAEGRICIAWGHKTRPLGGVNQSLNVLSYIVEIAGLGDKFAASG